jgi:hypothetical protein
LNQALDLRPCCAARHLYSPFPSALSWIAGIIKLVLGPAKPDPGARQ